MDVFQSEPDTSLASTKAETSDVINVANSNSDSTETRSSDGSDDVQTEASSSAAILVSSTRKSHCEEDEYCLRSQKLQKLEEPEGFDGSNGEKTETSAEPGTSSQSMPPPLYSPPPQYRKVEPDGDPETTAVCEGDQQESSRPMCTDTWHTEMCRAPSPKYYKGTDIDALVSEDEETVGDAVFADKIPDLVVDDDESSGAMSDNDGGSSVASSSSNQSSLHNASFSTASPLALADHRSSSSSGAEADAELDEVQRTRTTGNENSSEVASATGNVGERVGSPRPITNEETQEQRREETRSFGRLLPGTMEESSDDEESSGIQFLRERLTGSGSSRRRRKISTVKEPHPYVPPDIPAKNWRAFTHLDSCRRGILSPDMHRAEVRRSQHFIQQWEKECALHGHRGCVNSVSFNDSGSLLASSGDDLNVILWDWNTRKQMTKFDSGHHSNVFQSKFLPHCNDTSIITCARDGQVRHSSLSSTGTAYTTKLAQHKLSSHKLAVMRDNACQFLTCGEDGYVFHLDIRNVYSKKPQPVLTVNDDKDRPIELYAIDSCPANDNYFLVCGRDPHVIIYDRRNLSHGPVCRYRADGISEDDYRMSITCSVYSRLGTEIVASYSDDDIFVFDVQNHVIALDSEDDGCSSGSESPVCSSQDFLGSGEDVEKRGKGKERGGRCKRFTGHRNSRTVKGVNFLGTDSEFVVSGSDDGYIYIWDKNTEHIVQWLSGDEAGVVNVIEPHPTLPCMASSGLDHSVKVWTPSVREKKKTLLHGLASTMAENKKMRENDPVREGLFDARMLMLLMQSLSSSERRQIEGLEPEDSEEGDRDHDDENPSANHRATTGGSTVGCRTS